MRHYNQKPLHSLGNNNSRNLSASQARAASADMQAGSTVNKDRLARYQGKLYTVLYERQAAGQARITLQFFARPGNDWRPNAFEVLLNQVDFIDCILCGLRLTEQSYISRDRMNTTLYWHKDPCFAKWQAGERNER